jgi:hypothetical protein
MTTGAVSVKVVDVASKTVISGTGPIEVSLLHFDLNVMLTRSRS